MIAIMLDELWERASHLRWVTMNAAHEQALFHRGDTVRRVFRVMDGEVRLVRHQKSGHALTLQRASRGHFLADASLFADFYHCDAIADGYVTAASVAKAELKGFLQTDAHASELWMRHLSRTAQEARFRAEMISLKTVDERLDAWIDWNQCPLPEKGVWKRLAEEVAVSPEALYRALAKRR